MKFNVDIDPDIKEYLENQYKKYIQSTSMTRKEMTALRNWVKDGHSVYDNPDGAWLDGMCRMEFLDVYRDNEYIKEHTKGMSPEETRKFAMAYYGWNDSIEESPLVGEIDLSDIDLDHPFDV